MTKRSLHNVLYSHVKGVLLVCLGVLVATVIIAPMSKLFVTIAMALGVVLSLVSMEELTGGRGLSWLELPIVLIGDFLARVVSFEAVTRSQSWALTLQFVAAVFFTESIVLVLVRSRLERFNAERNAR
jgi:hypothetical protein